MVVVLIVSECHLLVEMLIWVQVEVDNDKTKLWL